MSLIQRIKLSQDAECAQAQYCFPVNAKASAKTMWIENHDLFVCDNRVSYLYLRVHRTCHQQSSG